MVIKTERKNGRELKVGATFFPANEPDAPYKVTEVATAKPGKHGSAKSIVTAKHIKNGKSLTNTYLASTEGVEVVTDFAYEYEVVYSKNGTEIVVDIEDGRSMHVQSFVRDDVDEVESAFQQFPEYVDAEGSPLCIKFSRLITGDKLIFWELLYVKPEDLQRVGILKYTA